MHSIVKVKDVTFEETRIWKKLMNEGVVHILKAGGSDTVVQQFKDLIETERFHGPSISKRLSLILTGGGIGGNGNKDTPIYELCHLVAFLQALGFEGRSGRFEFFLGLNKVTAPAIRSIIEERSQKEGWPTQAYSLTARGLKYHYGGDIFEIWYDRIPILVAFFEFLAGIDDATFFCEMDDIFEKMSASSPGIREIKDASNAIAARMRLWRRTNIRWAEHEEKFDRLASFLTRNKKGAGWEIHDDTILSFWEENSAGVSKPIREYETVFDAFMTLVSVLHSGDTAEAASNARRLGTSYEDNEIDIANEDKIEIFEWDSPLNIFDFPNLQNIGFFKDKTERRPMEKLMSYGPHAIGFQRAFLRVETFSPIQSVISNSLRFDAGSDKTQDAISCRTAQSYEIYREALKKIKSHTHNVSLAVMHVLQSRNAEPEKNFNAVADAAEKAFRDLRRKGFDETAFDEKRYFDFLTVAEALPKILSQLTIFIKNLAPQNLIQIFEDDVEKFSQQFKKIYGD